MKAFVIENKHIQRSELMDFGWGNGYVAIPVGHPMHGVDYNDIPVEVNGGLTFAEPADKLDWQELQEPGLAGAWVVGFDTMHSWDSLDRWPKEAVQAEADNLKTQLEQFTVNLTTMNTAEFKTGAFVADLSGVKGQIIEGAQTGRVRVAFGPNGTNWRDLKPEYLTLAETAKHTQGHIPTIQSL